MIRFALQSERLGPLSLVNHFIQRMGLEDTARSVRPLRPTLRSFACSRPGEVLRLLAVPEQAFMS
jgi:hypothetical protein